jgi:hypothetical protein
MRTRQLLLPAAQRLSLLRMLPLTLRADSSQARSRRHAACAPPINIHITAAPFYFFLLPVATLVAFCSVVACARSSSAHAALQSVLFNLKTKQPSGVAGAASFEVSRPAMEQLAKDLAAIEQAVLQASK